jgi:hypothetical protein
MRQMALASGQIALLKPNGLEVQIITIGDLLESKTPNMPTQLSPYIKATHTHTASKQEALL